LSKDHIVPKSRGGENSWMNVVTSCRDCNSTKGSKTLKEAKMELLYLPYVPSHYENMILQNRNILADQMEFLLAGVPKHSRILQN
jgi:5-methylcytosine-specific restriction endonuclease McrA